MANALRSGLYLVGFRRLVRNFGAPTDAGGTLICSAGVSLIDLVQVQLLQCMRRSLIVTLALLLVPDLCIDTYCVLFMKGSISGNEM